MLMARGHAVWADRVERACFNAAPGAIKKDWKALQYFSCPNQFLATLDSDHNVMEHGGQEDGVSAESGASHRLLRRQCASHLSQLRDPHVDEDCGRRIGGRVVWPVGRDRSRGRQLAAWCSIRRQPIIHFANASNSTSMPSGRLRFRLRCACPAGVPRRALRSTENRSPAVRDENGFIVLRRTFMPGERIALTLPMKLAVTHWPQNGIGIERGPIVYSLPIKENWTPRVEPKFTTEDFPSWEATPASEWNYGLAVDPEKLESEVRVEIKSGPAPGSIPGAIVDPWENPPATLSVPARKIVGWELQANPDHPEQKFTPPLPDLSLNRPAGEAERVSLVPYGSTQLRLTIFPAIPR